MPLPPAEAPRACEVRAPAALPRSPPETPSAPSPPGGAARADVRAPAVLPPSPLKASSAPSRPVEAACARADFDFAYGPVRLLESSSSSAAQIRKRDTRAQVSTLSQGDDLPDLVVLVANPPVGRTSLVSDSSSNLPAVSAPPQSSHGCTSLGPLVVAGLDVNAALREPSPPTNACGSSGGRRLGYYHRY